MESCKQREGMVTMTKRARLESFMRVVLALLIMLALMPATPLQAFADEQTPSTTTENNVVNDGSESAGAENSDGESSESTTPTDSTEVVPPSDSADEGTDEEGASTSDPAAQNALAAKAFEGVNTGSMDNPSTNAYNADIEDVGSVDNPYRILVGEGASCRPSAFWSNGENAASGGGQIIPDMRIIFENREGDVQDGTLLYSYDMNTAERNAENLEPTWKNAFRLSPYVASDTSTGVLRFATASKGSFEFYFPTFEFKVNAQYLTKDLSAEHQLKPGDVAQVTYYGAFDDGQTSRGTNYTINFDTTDSNTTYQEEFIVDEDGFITIDPLPTGGNYTVDKYSAETECPDDPSDDAPLSPQGAANVMLSMTAVGGDADGSILASGVNDTSKNQEQDGTPTLFYNHFNSKLPENEAAQFTFSLSGSGSNWATVDTSVAGRVHLYEGASIDDGILLWTADASAFAQDQNSKNTFTVTVPADYLSAGSTYSLVFDKSICTRDDSMQLGADILYRFDTDGVADDNVDTSSLADAIASCKDVLANAQIGEEDGQYSQDAAEAFSAAIDNAQGLYDSGTLVTAGLVKRAVVELQEALDTFLAAQNFSIVSIQITGVPVSVTAGDSGVASASVVTNPQDDRFVGVAWSASDNVAIDSQTGAWAANESGDAWIVATSTSDPSASSKFEFSVVAPATECSFTYLYDEQSKTATVTDAVISNNVPVDIVIPSSVEYEGAEYAVVSAGYADEPVFKGENAKLVKHLELPDTLVSIGANAFSNLTSLRAIDIPASVTSLGDSAFAFCSAVTEITGMEGLNSLPYHVFAYASALTAIDIPDNIVSLGVGPFVGSGLTSITGMTGVKELGESAFGSLYSLETIDMPQSITAIPNKLFWDAHSLKSVVIPSGVTSIGEGAFYNCGSLEGVDIPGSVTSLGDSAFSGCSSLTEITIPAGVENFGRQMFYNANKLTDVTFLTQDGSIPVFAYDSLMGINNVTFHVYDGASTVKQAVQAAIDSGQTGLSLEVMDEPSEPITYKQSDGYQPYTGWQGTAYRDTDDPLGASGGGGTNRKGYPSWSLVTPLSLGVSAYDGGATTGSEVTVVTDMNTTNLSGAGTYSDPWYYKNIILPSMDASDGTIEFTFNYLGAGGLTVSNLYDGNGGVIVSTSDDPADWNSSDKIAVTLDSAHTSVASTDDNWRKNVTFSVDATNLENDQTYYFVIKNGTKSGHARSWADFVFEFSIDKNRNAIWEGDLSSVSYVGDQGDGAKLGFYLPERSTITTNLHALASCWDNTATEPLAMDDGVATVRVHCDGGGSNWQSTSGFASAAAGKVHVHTSDPVADGVFNADGLTEAGSIAYNQVGEEDLPTYAGVDLAISGLEAGQTYWLVIDASFQPNTNKAIMKPIVLQFTTEDVAETSWSIGAANETDVTATYDAETATLAIAGTGAMKDFAQASDAPWFAEYGSAIKHVIIADGVTNVGSYALGLENLETVKGGNALATVADNAFTGATNLVAVDLSGCTLTSVAANSFGTVGNARAIATQRTVYVKDAASAQAIKDACAADVAAQTAVAVMNGGSFAADTAFEAGKLAEPAQEGYTFVTWTSDEFLQHPVSAWAPLSQYVLHAKFNEVQQPADPQEYADVAYNQGLDQTVRLLDVSKLPQSVVPTGVIQFYGETDEHYDNRFVDAFNGYDDIEFAYIMSRGTNANTGDGSYQLSFTLPYISIVNEAGETVASYDNGNGALKHLATYFNGNSTDKSGTITAVKIGVDAGALPEGTYTLRFGKDFGANNGTSFLGKNVDFQFEVAYPEQYTLSYSFDAQTGTATVTGVTALEGASAFGVTVPEKVTDPSTSAECTVTAVADNAFAGAEGATSVTLPATVESIGNGAFANMPNVEYVKVLSQGDAAKPAWGTGVFDGSANLMLYGYPTSSAPQAAEQYGNVTFASLENGIYVNGTAVANGGTVTLAAGSPQATVSIMKDGSIATTNYRGFITNTNVATHAGTAPSTWNVLTAQANGEADLVIEGVDGTEFATLKIKAEGFDANASTEGTVLTTAQGLGSNVQMANAGEIVTYAFDETKEYFDNHLTNPVGVENALFTINVGGPGSAWGIDRWSWDEFKQIVDENLWLENAQGDKVATFGNGLTWVQLSGELATQNTLMLSVDSGVMTPGETYALVAGENFAGHNMAAKLLKAVHWTFTAAATDLASCTVSEVADQEWTGSAIEPKPAVSVETPATRIWDPAAGKDAVTPAGTRTLEEGTDYTLSYSNNTESGEATVTVTGMGGFTGTVERTFTIGEEPQGNKLLLADIADAQGFLDGLTVAEDAANLTDGTQWVTPADADGFQKAIDDAKAAAEKADATQDDFDAARDALAQALETFKTESVKKAAVDETSLAGALDEASENLSSVQISADGTDVLTSATWVTPEDVTALAAAMAKAQGVLDDPANTQASVDQARADLAAAVDAFNAAKQQGGKVVDTAGDEGQTPGAGADEGSGNPAGGDQGQSQPTADGKAAIAQTGDTAPVLPLMVLVLLSLASMVYAVSRSTRQR